MRVVCPHCKETHEVFGIPTKELQERDFFLDQLKSTKQYVAEHVNELQYFILTLDKMLKNYE